MCSKNNIINIGYTPSNETYEITIVSMYSSLLNNPQSLINFYIVVPETFDKSNNFSCLKNYKNCNEINIIHVDSNKYKNMSSGLFYSNRLFSFEFPELIKIDKILYLSSHSIVNGNIQELYNIDITDVSAAATEFIYQRNIKDNFNIGKKIIFNNTALLINLENWRKEKIYEKFINRGFLEHIKTDLLISDNECFNVLVEHCKLLNFKYNYTEAW